MIIKVIAIMIITTYSITIFVIVSPLPSINIGGKKLGIKVTIKNRRIENTVVDIAKTSFLIWNLTRKGIDTDSKTPILPKVLDRIHNVVARLAELFDIKKSDIPLKLKVCNISRMPIVKKAHPRIIILKSADSSYTK